MAKERENAISPTRNEDYAEWYQQVIKAAELAETSVARGCMVIKPWGYGIWERIQSTLDRKIKETGHENAYFPLFIPLSLLEKEAGHIEGFAKECAVVTHHRLEAREGKLYPAAPLEEPYVVRPTSETIIGVSFSKWVQSYRDLPLLINQWANVVRWEMRPRLFLRTAEFLWQEGHTVHSSEDEAREGTIRMLDVYRDLAEEVLAIPVIRGEKPPHERFPGAVTTLTIEAMMQDGKALQAGTSHYLGTFSRAFDIKFLNRSGVEEFGYTTSWGVSTRLIGGVIMTHGDDDGLSLPPRIAPHQVVILPIAPKPEHVGEVDQCIDDVMSKLRGVSVWDEPLRVKVDNRDLRGGEKAWQWIKRGAPIRLEIGPRDAQARSVSLLRRDRDHKERIQVPIDSLSDVISKMLIEIQRGCFERAKQNLDSRTVSDVSGIDELRALFGSDESSGSASRFVRAPWCGCSESLAALDELKLTVRCIPLDQRNHSGRCFLTGKPAKDEAIFARAY